jgi:hypothetical protein
MKGRGTRDEGEEGEGHEGERVEDVTDYSLSLARSLAGPHDPCPSRAGTDSLLRLTSSLACFPPAASPDCAGQGDPGDPQ